MKKLYLLLVAISCMLFACKKIYHSTNPTPANYRMTSYSIVTTQHIVYPPTLTQIVTENYSFLYDASGRVSQEFYTTNDSTKIREGLANLSIKFVYTSDSIYKTTTDLSSTKLKEQDTFIINSYGQITNAYFPFEVHAFSYYGTLLANETVGYRDSGTLVTLNLSYTSNYDDFLYRLFNGTLTASFEDTGIRPDISPIDTAFDTVLSLPLTVSWFEQTNNETVTTFTHTANSYSDQLTGYNEYPVTITAADGNGVAVHPVTVPAGYCAQQFYQIYDYLLNRTGDYLQLQSFTTYGVNIYQQTHMLKSITSPYFNTNCSYIIDADSKVANTNVVIRDSLHKNVISHVYTLQWNTY